MVVVDGELTLMPWDLGAPSPPAQPSTFSNGSVRDGTSVALGVEDGGDTYAESSGDDRLSSQLHKWIVEGVLEAADGGRVRLAPGRLLHTQDRLRQSVVEVCPDTVPLFGS